MSVQVMNNTKTRAHKLEPFHGHMQRDLTVDNDIHRDSE